MLLYLEHTQNFEQVSIVWVEVQCRAIEMAPGYHFPIQKS